MIDELYNVDENETIECVEEITAVEMAWKYFLANKNKIRVVVQVSPAVRVTIGEWFGLDRGEDAMGKIVTALKLLGADVVVDSAIAEDVISIAEAEELKARWEKGNVLPLISSRCGAFVKYVKETHPEMAEYLLQSPSPMQAFSMLLKKHYDKQKDGKVTKVIALVPGSAKKNELDMGENVRAATDLVLTTQDLVELFEQADFNLVLLEKQAMDLPFGISSGCGYITSVAGGVAETLLRSISNDKSDEVIRKIMYSGVRGWESMRKAEMSLNGKCVKVGVACGLDKAEKVLSEIANGTSDYDFVEIVASEGGCIAGDAQPYDDPMTLKLRALGLWYMDSRRAARSAEISPSSASLYNAYTRLRWENEAVDPEVDLTPEVVECVCAEEVIEEIVEEPIVEQVIEEIVEEPVVEEVVEEIVEEPVVEEVVEEIVEEPIVEEVIEEIVEEPVVEEVIEEIVEEPIVEEVIEEIAEEPIVEEVVEEIAEEPIVEEVVEEIAEEPIVEEVAVTEIEELDEDFDEENQEEYLEDGKRNPYYRRLSRKERRKIKRMRRFEKSSK